MEVEVAFSFHSLFSQMVMIANGGQSALLCLRAYDGGVHQVPSKREERWKAPSLAPSIPFIRRQLLCCAVVVPEFRERERESSTNRARGNYILYDVGMTGCAPQIYVLRSNEQ